MNWQNDLPVYRRSLGSRLLVLEAPAGPARRACLQSWAEQAAAAGAQAHLARCDFDLAGPWAGLTDLIGDLVPRIEAERPDLMERHAGELVMVLPLLRRRLTVRNPTLTDSALPEEKVRNYPMDRAYRIVHGLIDLVVAWSEHTGAEHWAIACDSFELGGDLVKTFFQELMRRRGKALNLTLLVAGEMGGEVGGIAAGPLQGTLATVHVRRELSAEPEPLSPPAAMAARADALEELVRDNDIDFQAYLPELIHCCLHSSEPARVLVWQAHAFAVYNHFGLYRDALRYGETVMAHLDTILAATHSFTRWNLVGSLCNCYLALGEPERALDTVLREGLGRIEDPADLARVCYVLTLLHSRFLPQPDFALAESYVRQGLENLDRAKLAETERSFLRVFTWNGLAFIRHRQGRPDEALELCRSGFELLNRCLEPGQHRLHRSVLLYNMAQVYSALHAQDQAVEYYSAAIEFDPNYSEYYNERGNTFQSLGRLDEAIADYLKAIELSAPYQEVWTNLGQALRRAGRLDEAVHAYSQALDLEPQQVLPRLGRAQAQNALGRFEAALGDYSAALDGDPDQPLALANRASLFYESGQLDRALDDLDRAVALSPANPDLLYNRSLALADLGRGTEAARDLREVLELRPAAEEREEIESRIAWLISAGPGDRDSVPATLSA